VLFADTSDNADFVGFTIPRAKLFKDDIDDGKKQLVMTFDFTAEIQRHWAARRSLTTPASSRFRTAQLNRIGRERRGLILSPKGRASHAPLGGNHERKPLMTKKAEAFDLGSLDTIEACNKPAEIEIKHPVTGAATDVFIQRAGPRQQRLSRNRPHAGE
jgi:hypothetical protein